MDYTLTTLLANIRRRGSIPNTAVPGTQDSDLIALTNDVLQLKLAARLIRVREGYLRQTVDVALGSSTRYRIPTRALGNKLAAVMLLDAAGNVLAKLDEIPYGRLREFYSTSGTAGYTFEAGSLVLVPSNPISTATTIRFVYYARPSQLTSTSSDYYAVTAVDTSTGEITIGAHTITTSTKIDIIKATPPFEPVALSSLATAAGATTITVSTTLAARVEVGDYVCLEDKSPLAQVPGELYPLLAHLVAMEVLQAIGDRENHARLAETLPGLEKECMDLISPRNEEGAKKIMSSSGALGSVGGPWRRRYQGN